MTEKNIMDLAYDILSERMNDAFGELKKEYKGKKPFGKEPVSVEEQIYDYNTRGYEIFQEIANTQGIEAAEIYRNELENMKKKRGIR